MTMSLEEALGHPIACDKQPTVYVAMCADVFHRGHVNILEHAARLGRVVVGLLTDQAIASYKRSPMFGYEEREAVVRASCHVDQVVPQETLDYTPNLLKLRPSFVVHGDDWRSGVQSTTREQVSRTLANWGGQIVEVPYTAGISSTDLQVQIRRNGIPTTERVAQLHRLFSTRKLIRALECHSALCASIAQDVKHRPAPDRLVGYDAIWSSSLTDSTLRGKPDSEVVTLAARQTSLNEILEASTLPVIYDADSGGTAEQFAHAVRSLERLGVSAAVIEDKCGVKRNSLTEAGSIQMQAPVAEFCEKIQAGKQAQVGTDFMVVARVESLIMRKPMSDALERALQYVQAGADAILMHSKSGDASEICTFATRFREAGCSAPIVAVPSTYDRTYESELEAAGVNAVVYANHLMRASALAMRRTAQRILEHGRGSEASEDIMSIAELVALFE